jgi:DinB superfamily
MIGRPQESEAAPYYFNYINQVSSSDVLGTIQMQLPAVLKLCSGISEEKSLYRYAAEKWSIRQVLNHITDTERAFAFRALWFARGFKDPLASYDQNIAAAGAEADGVPWSAHVQEFETVRRATISLFQNLPTDAWSRTGIASDNKFTVRAVAYIIAGHVEHHSRILREKYGL